jgi:hypothetical protein
MKAISLIGGTLLLVLTVTLDCGAQGTMSFTFDGPPSIAAGTATVVQQYAESGVSFTPIDPSAPWSGFVRMGTPTPAKDPWYPNNSTAYLQALAGNTLKFAFFDGTPFNLFAVDLAEYATNFAYPLTVHFVGYTQDGSVVTTDLTTDGVIDGVGPLADFQTFHFGPEWSGLSRVEIPTDGWSLDNLVLSVPEPAPAGLMLGALGTLMTLRYRTRWRSPESRMANRLMRVAARTPRI